MDWLKQYKEEELKDIPRELAQYVAEKYWETPWNFQQKLTVIPNENFHPTDRPTIAVVEFYRVNEGAAYRVNAAINVDRTQVNRDGKVKEHRESTEDAATVEYTIEQFKPKTLFHFPTAIVDKNAEPVEHKVHVPEFRFDLEVEMSSVLYVDGSARNTEIAIFNGAMINEEEGIDSPIEAGLRSIDKGYAHSGKPMEFVVE